MSVLMKKEEKFTVWPYKTEKTIDEWLEISASAFRGYLSMLKKFNTDTIILLKIHEILSNERFQQSLKTIPKKERKKIQQCLEKVPEFHRLEKVDVSSFVKLSTKSAILVLEQIKQFTSSLAYPLLIREMSLVNLVSKFEDFLGKSLEIIFIFRPELLLSSNKQMKFGDAIKFKGIESLRYYVIKQELDDLLRKDIEDIDGYLKKRIKIRLSSRKDWSKFKEVFHRRNIVVHNNSQVNDIYRIKTGYKGSNTVLTIDSDYLMSAIGIMKDYSEYIRDALLKQYVKPRIR